MPKLFYRDYSTGMPLAMTAKTAKELNELSHRIIGIAIDIHKKLGPGFQEKIYEQALLKEFERSEIGFEKRKGESVHRSYGELVQGEMRQIVSIEIGKYDERR